MHIKVENISKHFYEKTAINELSFEARAGYVLGILGPEGAGKSTIMRMLADVSKPDTGEIFYDDKPITQKARNNIGYMPEKRGLYQEYSLNKILVYFARLKNLSRKKAHVEAVRLMDRFSLIEQMDTLIQDLSLEIQQKIHMMLAIIHNPDLIILDEPFKNMAESNQDLARKLVAHFKEEGKTIILATDQLAEAESLCDEVLLIDHGQQVLQDKLAKIKSKFNENLIYVEASDDLHSLQDIYGVKKLIEENQTARLYIDREVPTQKILDIIIRSVHVTRLEVHPPNLSDIFTEVIYNRKKENA